MIHASTWFAPVLVPLIVYFLSSDSDVKRLSIQGLLFHLIMGALITISFILSFVIIGIPLLLFFGILALYAPIKGIVFAVQNRDFQYPFLGFIK